MVIRRLGQSRSLVEMDSSDVELMLDALKITVSRDIAGSYPYEVSVIVPRAEITRKYKDGELLELSAVYSSVTVVYSPRHAPTDSAYPAK